MNQPLLPPSLLPRLERLSLNSGRQVRGTAQGKRLSGRFGTSQEFADYREYTPGDDIRRFDWGVYRRTGRPFVRQYWDEQELMVSLYLDISASMDFGEENKLHYAKKLAAAIGYMALAADDRVEGALFTDAIRQKLPAVRGKASALRLFRFLQEAEPSGPGNLRSALRSTASLPVRPGMTWIFSDLWLEDGVDALKDALSYLMAAGQDIVLVHVVSPAEIKPLFSGDLRLVDSELGTGKELAISGRFLESYAAEWKNYTGRISAFCMERGIRYVIIPTDLPLEKGIFETLRRAGILG
ncbi:MULTISPECIES: DUF58 domain-containing protein [Paenibacillus]|uniref:DUF58 domain-containing protein n=1 Tax=Paenibacillus TaxID=44249 RepID=UPI002FE18E02